MRSKHKKTRPVANPLGLAILALLFEKPLHPYEMAATLRERAKDQSIRLNYGSLYTVIGALERAGFIASGAKVRQGARPERTVYTITSTGDAELFDWMRELLSTPMKEYPQFEAALSLLPILPPGEAKALLEKRVGLLEEQLRGLRQVHEEAARQGLARLFLIEGEYEVAMRDAERKWVVELIRLMNSSEEFTSGWRKWHEQRRDSPAKEVAGHAGEKRTGGDRARRTGAKSSKS